MGDKTVLHIDDENNNDLATIEFRQGQGLSWLCIECGDSAANFSKRWLDVLWDFGRHMDAGHANPARGMR